MLVITITVLNAIQKANLTVAEHRLPLMRGRGSDKNGPFWKAIQRTSEPDFKRSPLCGVYRAGVSPFALLKEVLLR